MKKIIVAILSLSAVSVWAEQWQVLGTRPMGMGGAYVAMARGPIAQYWNPAGLAQVSSQTFSGLEIPVGAGIEVTGKLLDNVSNITEVANQIDGVRKSNSTDKVNADEMSAFIKTLGSLEKINKNEDSGSLIEVAGGLNLKISKIALSINNYTAAGLNPFIDSRNIKVVDDTTVGSNLPTGTGDPTITRPDYKDARNNLSQAIDNIGFGNIEDLFCGTGVNCFSGVYGNSTDLANALTNEAITNGISAGELTEISNEAVQYSSDAGEIIKNVATGGSFDDNKSNINLKAASFFEAAIGYGRYVNFLPGLAIGGNIKVIQGNIANKTFEFLKEDETKDVFDDFLDNKESSMKPAFDLGFLWDVNQKYPKIPLHPTLGLTIRNINSPSFDGPTGKYKLDRQARFGVSLRPFNWWHLSADVDLTENDTEVDGYKSRELAFGTEINIINRKSFNLPLRLGLMKNLANSNSSTMYTAGLGLTFAYIHFDVAAGISSGETEIDGDKYPEKGQVVASLGILF
ncbi:MAG: conjugal transfer protein TraF [Elusimicrobia bacterium]|nr:conjugal transfer protein TraF [Elusimicrobiota bacterium]